MSVLLVALDGLDKKYIEKYNCSSFTSMRTYGTIDNSTGFSSIKTSELFASLITGEMHPEHGIRGLAKNSRSENLINLLIPNFLKENLRGFNRLEVTLETALNVNKEYYDKRDLEIPTLFDTIDNSKAMFVPSYNPSLFWKKNALGFSFRQVDYENRDLEYYWREYEFKRRKSELFRPINQWFDFLMVHFHLADVYQHIYSNLSEEADDKKLSEVYNEADQLAEEIIDYFSESYDLIIFMSDHGVPTEKEHNERAFFSSNEDIFEEDPHLTDFYNLIENEVKGQ